MSAWKGSASTRAHARGEAISHICGYEELGGRTMFCSISEPVGSFSSAEPRNGVCKLQAQNTMRPRKGGVTQVSEKIT